MTITQKLYARRNGKILFWRIGRLGGSVYLSRNSHNGAKIAGAERKARRAAWDQAIRTAEMADIMRRVTAISGIMVELEITKEAN